MLRICKFRKYNELLETMNYAIGRCLRTKRNRLFRKNSVLKYKGGCLNWKKPPKIFTLILMIWRMLTAYFDYWISKEVCHGEKGFLVRSFFYEFFQGRHRYFLHDRLNNFFFLLHLITGKKDTFKYVFIMTFECPRTARINKSDKIVKQC